MHWACSMRGATRNGYKILDGKPKGKDHSEHLRVDGRIILKWLTGNYRVDFIRVWIKDRWRAPVNRIMNHKDP
jgi:hypothetical protein